MLHMLVCLFGDPVWQIMQGIITINTFKAGYTSSKISTGFSNGNILNVSFAEKCFSKRHFRNWETGCKHRNYSYSNFSISPPLSTNAFYNERCF